MHLSPVLRFSRLKRRTKKRRRQLVEISFSTANMGIFHHINWIPKEILTLKCLWHFKKITPKTYHSPIPLAHPPQQKHTTRKTKKAHEIQGTFVYEGVTRSHGQRVHFLPWKSASVLHIDLQPSLKLPVILHQQQLGLHLSS